MPSWFSARRSTIVIVTFVYKCAFRFRCRFRFLRYERSPFQRIGGDCPRATPRAASRTHATRSSNRSDSKTSRRAPGRLGAVRRKLDQGRCFRDLEVRSRSSVRPRVRRTVPPAASHAHLRVAQPAPTAFAAEQADRPARWIRCRIRRREPPRISLFQRRPQPQASVVGCMESEQGFQGSQ